MRCSGGGLAGGPEGSASFALELDGGSSSASTEFAKALLGPERETVDSINF